MDATLVCSHCGEMRTEGQFHDPRRCWTIAHAFAIAVQCETLGDTPEIQRHIVELARWLRDHQSWSTTDGLRAIRDRQISLDRWITKAQMMTAGHTAAAPQN